MIRIGLVGGRGYVGAELLRLLGPHPEFEIGYVGSASLAGTRVIDEMPDLNNSVDAELQFSVLDVAKMRNAAIDMWVLAQSNGQAAQWVDDLDGGSQRFLDISADFRFDDSWVYGLPERNRQSLRRASRVANPGCYATAIQLALLPLADTIDGMPVALGVSGYSGAGKTPSPKNDPERLLDNLIPYSLAGHTHEREVAHQMGRAIQFMPHVAQFFRGISVTLCVPSPNMTLSDAHSRFESAYREEPLVEVVSDPPEIREIVNRPGCRLGGLTLSSSADSLVIVSVLDNLLKGAASQALQNLNLMAGCEELLGIAANSPGL